jgi:hypothetical protein
MSYINSPAEIDQDYSGDVQPYVARVLDCFESVRRAGDGWLARCPVPAHGDRRPSLRITIGDEGRVLVHCRGGCETITVLSQAALRFDDLFPGHGESPMEPLVEDHYVEPYVSKELLDAVYRDVLAGLALREPHRADLRRRGLGDDRIAEGQYRSLMTTDKPELARNLYGKYHDDLFLVPGFGWGDRGRR